MQTTVSPFTIIPKTLTCIYLFMVLSLVSVTGQTDTVFWFAAPEVAARDAAGRQRDRPVYLRVITLNQAANVTISQPAGGGMPDQAMTIPGNSTQAIDLTPWIDLIENKPGNMVLNYGLKIKSDVPVMAYYSMLSQLDPSARRRTQPEVFSLKGGRALGTDFWIPTQNKYSLATGTTPATTAHFNIIATEDSTNVTIIPSNAITGHATGVPFTITLNKGQTYAAVASGTTGVTQLSGSRVTSTKPVAITVCGDPVPIGGDVTGDQLVPTKMLGKEYAVLNGWLAKSGGQWGSYGDDLFIVGTEDTTIIKRDGTQVATINAGETFSINMTGAEATYIESSKPVVLWQFSGADGQPGATQVPKLLCAGSRSVPYVFSLDSDPNALLLNVVVAKGGENDFTVNGSATVLTGVMFKPVPGTNGNWLYCRLSITTPAYQVGDIIKVDNKTTNFQLSVVEGSAWTDNPTNAWGATVGYFSEFSGGVAVSNILGDDTTLCLGDTLLLDATLSGATDYLWSTGQTTPGIHVEAPGTYWVRVSTTNCTSRDTIVIAAKTAPESFSIGNDTSICNSGHLILKPSPRPTEGTYHWQDGTTDTTLTINAPGHYRLTIKNICGNATDSIYIDKPMEDLSPYLTTLASCHNTAGGNAWIKLPATDTNKYRYAWMNTEGALLSSTDSLRNVRAGNYYLNIRSGICDTTLPFTISETKYTASFISDTLICTSQPTTLHNTSDPYYTHFIWYFGNGTTSLLSNPTYTYNPGSYEITLVATGLSCQDTAKGRIEVEQTADSFKILKNKEYACTGEEIILSTTPHTNESPLTWSLGDGNTVTTKVSTLHHAYDHKGTMTLTIRTNQKVCPDFIIQDTITIYPLPTAYLGPDTGICLNGKSIILTNIFPHEKGYQYHWNTGDTTQQLQVTHPGIYSLTVTSQQGCATTETIEINKSCYTDLPNAFSPNGDGENDYFFPRQLLSRQLTAFNMKILNRWGQIIFRTTDTKGRGWDGKFNGEEQPVGVYVYIIDIETNHHNTEQYKGNVTLIR